MEYVHIIVIFSVSVYISAYVTWNNSFLQKISAHNLLKYISVVKFLFLCCRENASFGIQLICYVKKLEYLCTFWHVFSLSASRLWLGSWFWCQGGQLWNLPWWWESVWNSERGLLQERGIRWLQMSLVSCHFLGLPEHKRKYMLIQVKSVLYCIIKLQLSFVIYICETSYLEWDS
jgi:hypothetical protein